MLKVIEKELGLRFPPFDTSKHNSARRVGEAEATMQYLPSGRRGSLTVPLASVTIVSRSSPATAESTSFTSFWGFPSIKTVIRAFWEEGRVSTTSTSEHALTGQLTKTRHPATAAKALIAVNFPAG